MVLCTSVTQSRKNGEVNIRSTIQKSITFNQLVTRHSSSWWQIAETRHIVYINTIRYDSVYLTCSKKLWLTSRKPLWLDLQPVDIKSRWRHNWKSAQVVNSHLVCDPTIRQPGFGPPSATVVSAKPFSHGTGTLRCLQKEMATYRHWSVSLWRDPHDVSHCRILSPDKTEWRLISATLCGWGRCFVADQLW